MPHKGTPKGIQKRKEMLDFIIAYMQQHGYAPTYREIGDGVSLSLATVKTNIDIMASEGMLERDAGERTIRVPGYKFVKV